MSIFKLTGVRIFTLILTLPMALAVYAQSGDQSPKNTDYIEVTGKIVSIDTSKGDVSTRLEFTPHGKFANEKDGTLTKDIKFDTPSASGKQEITFDKGKKMSATEVLLSMYDGEVADYPFDSHKVQLIFYFTVKPDKPADKPKSAESQPEGEVKPAAAEEDDNEVDVPFTLDFEPKMPGYTFTMERGKDSDDTWVDLEIGIQRSTMTTLFVVFIMVLMWGVSLGVVAMIFTVGIKGRKAELGMFSFISALLFAFVTVRNNQPGVPPVGTLSDDASFFWAVAILGLCLIAVLFIWVFRKPA